MHEISLDDCGQISGGTPLTLISFGLGLIGAAGPVREFFDGFFDGFGRI